MLLNTKQLVGVSVVTRSQQKIGKVASFDVHAETGRLAVMHVKAANLVARLSEDELLVPWDAIIEMTGACIVIADGAVRAPAAALATTMTPSTSSPLMREI